MRSHAAVFSSVALACALAFLAAPLLAQEEPAEGAPAEGAASPSIISVPPEYRSARATMRTFLQAFDPQYQRPGTDPLAAAAACLDLSEIPEDVRGVRGPELALDLKDILDRTVLIDFATISDEAEGLAYHLQAHPPKLGKPGVVMIAPDKNGIWLFESATVAAIPGMLRDVASREKVEGVITEGPRTVSRWLRDAVPAPLREVGFLLEHWQWLALLILILVGMIADRMVTASVQASVSRHLARWLKDVKVDELRTALRPIGLLVASFLWWLGLTWLGLPTETLAVLLGAVRFIAATAIVWAAYRVVDIVSRVLEARAAETQSKLDDLLVPLVRKSLKVFIVTFGLIFIADALKLPITSLLTGIGIGGLAVALAAQDTVKNVFGSFMVILDQPFHVGDWIVVGGTEGVVAEVGFRSTRIRTFYNSIVTVPNANLISASVDNYGAREFRRWSTRLGVAYDTPPERLEAFCEGIRELIRRHPYTRKDFFEVQLNEFGASSLEIMLYMFFTTPDWSTELRERHRLGVDILRLAKALGVEFAFPTQTLHLHRGTATEAVPAVDGYDGRVEDVLDDARRQARQLVDDALGGEIPPPVGVKTRGRDEEEGY